MVLSGVADELVQKKVMLYSNKLCMNANNYFEVIFISKYHLYVSRVIDTVF